MHLRLETGAQLHELGSITDQLPKLPDRRRRDPRLRKAVEPQHVRQVRRVDHVVLDATVTPVERPRVRKMHNRAECLE